MLDIKFVRENKEIVKENIKKKFQDEKLPLVDEVVELDEKIRALKQEGDELRKTRNDESSSIGLLMREKKVEEAGKKKEEVKKINEKLVTIEEDEKKLSDELRSKMMVIPNIMDPSVPIGKDDSENVEVERFGDAYKPEFEIPYHADIIMRLNGMDKEAAGRTSGEGFYFLTGDVARLHEAMIAYARDYMIDKGFTYCVPPFMIHSDVVTGVMSFPEMEAMMYKIEGEDLYLIGTSEHSMIGRYKGQIIKEEDLPLTLTSYSPCFRKEGGSHGLEERGLYRVHQFEKEEMIVICKPEESMDWYEKMWRYTVEVFRNMNVPVRQLECCSGDLADLKVKSCDVEAWSPRQQKYFEVGSCSTLGDAQARRLGIRTKGENGTYFVHTLNNTVVASPRGLIAVIENNYNYIQYLYDNYFIVGGDSGKSGIVNDKGEEILQTNYEVIQRLDNSDIIQAMVGNVLELYNKQMSKIISMEEGKLDISNNYIKVYSTTQTAYVSLDGSLKTDFEIFPDNKLFAAEKEGRWGFIDKNNNVKLDYQYDKVTELNELGFAGIKKDGKWGVIDKDGNIILEPTYTIPEQNGEPYFIGKYYKVISGYEEEYFTDDLNE